MITSLRQAGKALLRERINASNIERFEASATKFSDQGGKTGKGTRADDDADKDHDFLASLNPQKKPPRLKNADEELAFSYYL